MRLGVEGGLARTELVDDTAERPDVRLERVLFGSADLGRHVEWCADVGGGEVVRLDHLGKAKVAQFDRIVFAEKDWWRRLVSANALEGRRRWGRMRHEEE